jgi:hypothetical protein
MENILVLRLHHNLFCQSADLRGCALIRLLHGGIESSDAAKPRGERDFSHGQPGFIHQLLRKMETASVCHRARSRAQMAYKKTPEMPRPDSQAIGESFHAPVFESSFADKAQCSGDSIRSAEPSRCSRGAFWTATKAGAKAGLRGRSGGWIVPNITFTASACRANRTAINSGRKHANEKLAVETCISREPGSRTNLPIEHHHPTQQSKVAAGITPPFQIIIPRGIQLGRFRTRHQWLFMSTMKRRNASQPGEAAIVRRTFNG